MFRSFVGWLFILFFKLMLPCLPAKLFVCQLMLLFFLCTHADYEHSMTWPSFPFSLQILICNSYLTDRHPASREFAIYLFIFICQCLSNRLALLDIFFCWWVFRSHSKCRCFSRSARCQFMNIFSGFCYYQRKCAFLTYSTYVWCDKKKSASVYKLDMIAS